MTAPPLYGSWSELREIIWAAAYAGWGCTDNPRDLAAFMTATVSAARWTGKPEERAPLRAAQTADDASGMNPESGS